VGGQDAQRREVERRIQSRVGFDAYPDGPLLDRFDPLTLAEALEREATRALIAFDTPKVDLRMDAQDALDLAAWLRQAPGRKA
jgi:hypothetical protein